MNSRFMYVLPVAAGIVMIVLATLGWQFGYDFSVIDASLAAFGAALIAAPVIAKIKFGPSGFEIETTSKLSEAVEQQGKAIKTINDSLKKMNESIAALQKMPDEFGTMLSAEISIPKRGTEAAIDWKNILPKYITPKTLEFGTTSEIESALRSNETLIAKASELNQQVKAALAKLR